MNRSATLLVLAFSVIFIFSGCGIVSKDMFKQEVSGIKTKVETLESRLEGVEAKQSETEQVTSKQGQALQQLTMEELQQMKERRVKTNIAVKPRIAKGKERTKEIQLCLKNAGFYEGKIDGIKGRNTRKAIREFQKASGLNADGVVGKKTWALLSKYMEGPAKVSGAAEEGATK
ncbi:MAG: peptidoglycan-binding protein [Candidatus Omnitrophica bacterium]|nr:peptidoglycan-binding protein [Candidatus Omnitrophota bacterium]